MNTKAKVAVALSLLGVGGATSTWILRAQTPVKPRVVQVSSRGPAGPVAEGRRTATPAAVPNASPSDTAKASESAAPASEVLVTRETYSYPAAGRRDPFVSLMNTEQLRPLLSDLRLVGIGFDPLGRNSVAVLRDRSNDEQYRVRVGQEIGRMRVASIREKSVVFGIEEFGYSRQETLAMSDSTKVRTQ